MTNDKAANIYPTLERDGITLEQLEPIWNSVAASDSRICLIVTNTKHANAVEAT